VLVGGASCSWFVMVVGCWVAVCGAVAQAVQSVYLSIINHCSSEVRCQLGLEDPRKKPVKAAFGQFGVSWGRP